jgi:predicted RNA-binding protein YlxR (DUF448 family)
LIESIVPGSKSTRTARGTYLHKRRSEVGVMENERICAKFRRVKKAWTHFLAEASLK